MADPYIERAFNTLATWVRVGQHTGLNPLNRHHHHVCIEEEQTTQWLKEKVQKDKQRSIKHTYKAKDRVTRTPLKTGVYSI